MFIKFGTDYIGKSTIRSHYNQCGCCQRLTRLNSYSTRRFLTFCNLPLIPLGTYQILDECSHCGRRGATSSRKFKRERKSNLAHMMDGFANDADNPDNCAQALHTLMTYNEASWFQDMRESYGLRFEKDPKIQLLMAQGLCRFGKYAQAIDNARIAVVLGAGKPAEDLIAFCQKLADATPENTNSSPAQIQPEPVWQAFIPMFTLIAALVAVLTVQGISAMRTYQAWLVNGSLEEYSFELDGKTYQLEAGRHRPIRLKLGWHEMQFGEMAPLAFEYSISFAKQLFEKNLLIINPDATALFSIEIEQDGQKKAYLSNGKQIHELSGVGYPLFGFHENKVEGSATDGVTLFRPTTHLAMIEHLRNHGLEKDAVLYARRTLTMTPACQEMDPLLDIALSDFSPEQKIAFLRRGITAVPALMPWHLRYQKVARASLPDHDLIREYTTMCAEHTDEPVYCFLLARIMNNAPDAYTLYEYSEKAGGMNGQGFSAIAKDLVARGEFTQALDYVQEAQNKDPENPIARSLHEEILLALQSYDELLAITREDDPEKTVRHLTFAGHHQQAESAISRFSEEDQAQLAHLNAIRFYAVGNVSDYHTCLAEAGDTHVELEADLHASRIAAAHQQMLDDSAHPWWEHLVLYYAAARNQDMETAQYHLDHAIDDLNPDNPDYQHTARVLSSATAPDTDAVKRLHIDSREKALVCMALSMRFPEQRHAYTQLAHTFNYHPAYPQLLLKKWLRADRPRKAVSQPAA